MATVLDVAKYILSIEGQMTTMKLQKLCYYSQAWSLAWDEVPIFDEEFEAWSNGPVCPELFRTHKGKFVINEDDIGIDKISLNDEQKDTIDKVLEFYGDKEPNWLSQLTHQEMPWRQARVLANARPGEMCNQIISKESMQSYYSGL